MYGFSCTGKVFFFLVELGQFCISGGEPKGIFAGFIIGNGLLKER